MPSEKLLCGMSVWTQQTKIVVSGQTFKHKEVLKSLGGLWNPVLKNWEFALNTDLSVLSLLAPTWACCQDAIILNVQNRMYVCETHYPDISKPGKPYWFCGHPGATVSCHSGQMSFCTTCSPCPHTGGFLVNGRTWTSD